MPGPGPAPAKRPRLRRAGFARHFPAHPGRGRFPPRRGRRGAGAAASRGGRGIPGEDGGERRGRLRGGESGLPSRPPQAERQVRRRLLPLPPSSSSCSSRGRIWPPLRGWRRSIPARSQPPAGALASPFPFGAAGGAGGHRSLPPLCCLRARRPWPGGGGGRRFAFHSGN